MKLCFVIPVYNECPTLEGLVEGIEEHAAAWERRILFVDDGSTDGSGEALSRLAERFSAVRVIRFPENQGKTQALRVAFRYAEGDVIITMDGDLQDRPEEIPKLVAKLEEGYDFVCGWKAVRNDPWHKTFPSKIYNACVARLFGLDLHDVNTGFKAMRFEVARRLPLYGDMHRMMAVFAAHLGYRVGEVAVAHEPRRHGESKYGFHRYYRGALDACMAWFLTRYTGSWGQRLFFGGGAGVPALISVYLLAAGGCPLLSVAAGVLSGVAAGALAIFVLGLAPIAEWFSRETDAEVLDLYQGGDGEG